MTYYIRKADIINLEDPVDMRLSLLKEGREAAEENEETNRRHQRACFL
ncbi:hypothetical protein [Domibacillus sp.]|nr:hypothetical protein [Domibacillus sp.]